MSHFSKDADMADVSGPTTGKRVLILGGSTFVGRTLVRRLLAKRGDEVAAVVLLNRGRTYWRHDEPKFPPTDPRLVQLVADRRKHSAFAEKIAEATARYGHAVAAVGSCGVRVSSGWDVILDFSAFCADDMKPVEDGLKLAGLARGEAAGVGPRSPSHTSETTYLYISSDSVYEVCDLEGGVELNHVHFEHAADTVLVHEAHANRPLDKKARKRLNREDSYADGKLQVEEVLQRWTSSRTSASSAGLGLEVGQAISLRLPDIVGPYDDTGRLFAYWLAFHFFDKICCESADETEQPVAVVFSDDVARFVVEEIVLRSCTFRSKCRGQHEHYAVNFGCREQPPLVDHLRLFREVAAEGWEAKRNEKVGEAERAHADAKNPRGEYSPPSRQHAREENGRSPVDSKRCDEGEESNTDHIKILCERVQRCSVEDGRNVGKASSETRLRKHFLPSVQRRRLPLDYATVGELFPKYQPTPLRKVYEACDAFFRRCVGDGSSFGSDEFREAVSKLPRRALDESRQRIASALVAAGSSSVSSDGEVCHSTSKLISFLNGDLRALDSSSSEDDSSESESSSEG